MQQGWLENNSDYYLHLIHPSSKGIEQQIITSFSDFHKKFFGENPAKKFDYLTFNKVVNGEHKGKKTKKLE